MKSRPLSKLSKYLVFCLLLLFLTPLIFGCGSGSDGAAGAKGADGTPGTPGTPGTDATSYGTVTGTVKNLFGDVVAGATVTLSPAVSGVTIAPTDADGKYTASLPNGAYTLTFAKSGYVSQPLASTAVATKTSTLDVYLVSTGPVAVNAGADVAKAPGETVTLAATVTKFDPSVTGTPTYAWSIVPDPVWGTGNVTIAGATTASPTVTLLSSAAYKAQLVEKNAAFNYDFTPTALNRWRVVPLTVGALRQPSQGIMRAAVLRLTVTYPGFAPVKDDVNIGVTMPFVPNNGLRNVPIGQPVLLQGKVQATYAWTMTKPAGSAATLNDATTRYPDFTPDAKGVYTLSEATGGAGVITINAGTYEGALAGPNQVSASCSTAICHTRFDAAARASSWIATGHKNVMIEGMKELPPGGHYAATCAPCHTVGTKYFNTAVNSNSFADLSVSELDADGKNLFTWFNDSHVQGNPNIETMIATRFPKTYRVSGIQCETCHGPNTDSGAHGAYRDTNALTATARIDYSSNSCAFCHGRPTSHAAFTQWNVSGHGNYELAESEGTSSRTGCAGCHSAQGFFLLKAQLADGKGNRTITLPAGQAAWTADAVEPITCIVCHDPHDEGNLMVSEEVPTRISGNTDMLPAGFMASGVGRGAQCIFCHNSRNGYVAATGATLHEDGDVNFSTNMTTTANSYTAPHAASQGDVLMGRNAYFLGATPGQRSKHSYIADSCVECHMKLSKAPSTIGSASRPDHTFGNSVAEVCGDCHGGYTSEQTMIGFDYQLGVLNLEIAKAVYRIKNGVNPPAGTTVSFTAGRTTYIVVNGVSTALHTTANTGYLDGVAGLTLGYDPTIAKLNWNYELMRTGAGRGTHNPGFSQRVLDASLAAAKAR